MMHDWMKAAISEAEKALKQGEVPVGAVIICDNQIIGRGYNQKETLKDPTAHAEMIAIRQAAEVKGTWRMDDCALVVTAEPCPMCAGAMIQARIPLLIYGVSEPRFGGMESTADLRHHPQLPKDMQIFPGICEAECRKLLQIFFEGKRK